jgi:non-ribosomal peptide synthase protein (TIGR01720 family)
VHQPALSSREKLLAAIWAEVLGIDRVGTDDNFFELGGDSILSIQIVARAGEHGLKITPKQIFEEKTLGRLAAAAEKTGDRSETKDEPPGEIPLTPIQVWFFERGLPDPGYFNQALLLEIEVPLDPALLEQALQVLAERHDAMRMQFRKRNGAGVGWTPMLADPRETAVFSVEPAADLEKRCAAAQASLDLGNGPLMRVVLFQDAGERSRLLIVMHHLIVDAVSWRIVLEELGTAYLQLRSGRAVRLPLPSTSYARWAMSLVAHANSSKIRSHLDAFRAIAAPVTPLPRDFEGGRNLEGLASRMTVSLTSEETRILLNDLPRVWHIPIHDALIAALVQALAEWTGNGQQLIDIEGHGREEFNGEVNLSRTVGWFTTLCPIVVDAGVQDAPISRLVRIHEQLRDLPARALAFGLLRYLADAGCRQVMSGLPRAEVIFNFMGQSRQGSAGSLWRPAAASIGPSRSSRQPRSHLIELNAEIIDGVLSAEFTYATDCHMATTIASLAARFNSVLKALVMECRSAPRTYRPSDFPEASLSQAELDQALAELGITQENER